MTNMKLALCSALLLSSVVSFAQPAIESATTDKRILTIEPVSSNGYLLYNIGLSMLLKNNPPMPIPMPIPPEMQAFLDSYQVANVSLPNKRPYNGPIKFDIVSTESGVGVGHYEFNQTYDGKKVTLRVITSPVPSIPMTREISEGLFYLSQLIEQQ